MVVKLLSIAATILLSLNSFAQSCPGADNAGKGAGVDPMCFTHQTNWNGDPTQLRVCGQTQQPSDFMFESYLYQSGGYTSPDAETWWAYTPNFTTNYCAVLTGMFPTKTYLLNGASSHDGLHCDTDVRCGLGDEAASIAEYGQGANGIQVTIPAPTGTVFGWSASAGGTAPYTFPGKQLTVPISPLWKTGDTNHTPSFIFFPSITINGQSCTAGLPGACPSGIRVQHACDNSENMTPQTRNLNSPIASGGAKSGQPFCSQPPTLMTLFGQSRMFIVNDIGNAAPGHYHEVVQMQSTDGNETNIGGLVTMSYDFDVKPTPTWAPNPAINFPPIPNLNKLPLWWANTALPQFVSAVNAQKQQGHYWNGTFSATETAIPNAVWNYNSPNVLYFERDHNDAVTAQWQPGTQVHAGDTIKFSGVAYIALSDGTTGSTQPSFPTSAGAISARDGSVSGWENAADDNFLTDAIDRVMDEKGDWDWFHTRYGQANEWQIPNAYSIAQFAFRNYPNGGGCNGWPARLLSYNLYPFNPPSNNTWANQNQLSQWYHFAPQTDTRRPIGFLDDTLDARASLGCSPMESNGVVDDRQWRDNVILTDLAEQQTYNWFTMNGNGPALYDYGMELRTAIYRCQETRDPAICSEIFGTLDAVWSRYWVDDTLGTPYTPGTRPYNSRMYNAGNYHDLDGFLMQAMAWCNAADAGHVLPSTGETCLEVSDRLFNDMMDHASQTAKAVTEAGWGIADWYGWRTGTLRWDQASWRSDVNPYQGFTDAPIEPYPMGVYLPPTGTPLNSGGCVDIDYYTTQQVQPEAQLSNSCTGQYLTDVTGGTSTFLTGSERLWHNHLHTCGLPSAQYCMRVGGTNVAGLRGMSGWDPETSHEDFGFYIPPWSSGGCNIQVGPINPPVAVPGQQNYSYQIPITAGSGCALPLKVTLTGGLLLQ